MLDHVFNYTLFSSWGCLSNIRSLQLLLISYCMVLYYSSDQRAMAIQSNYIY